MTNSFFIWQLQWLLLYNYVIWLWNGSDDLLLLECQVVYVTLNVIRSSIFQDGTFASACFQHISFRCIKPTFDSAVGGSVAKSRKKSTKNVAIIISVIRFCQNLPCGKLLTFCVLIIWGSACYDYTQKEYFLKFDKLSNYNNKQSTTGAPIRTSFINLYSKM